MLFFSEVTSEGAGFLAIHFECLLQRGAEASEQACTALGLAIDAGDFLNPADPPTLVSPNDDCELILHGFSTFLKRLLRWAEIDIARVYAAARRHSPLGA